MARQSAQNANGETNLSKRSKLLDEKERKLRALQLALNERARTLKKSEDYLANCWKEIKEKQDLVQCKDVNGLTRSSLLSKRWHKEHPEAVNHLFGFPTWKELVCIFHALFDVLPPVDCDLMKTPVSKFEQYLMGFMT